MKKKHSYPFSQIFPSESSLLPLPGIYTCEICKRCSVWIFLVTIHGRIAHLLRDYGPYLRRFHRNRALRHEPVLADSVSFAD